jgi:hypothetical protein
MSTRYYLTDIISVNNGDGDEYLTAVAQYPVKSESAIPVNMETGIPLRNWTLAIVEADDHAPLLADPRIDGLPDFPLDGKVSSINTAAKNAMLAAMTRRGIDTASVTGTDGYREVINLIGAAASNEFNVNSFSV